MPRFSLVPRFGVVAVVCFGARFLVIRRSQLVRAPGAFCFPGGGVLPGESEPDALRREMREELSTSVRPWRRLWKSKTPNGVRLAWWHTRLLLGESVRPNLAEVESVHWLTAEQMLQLPDLLPTNRAFLAALGRRDFQLERP